MFSGFAEDVQEKYVMGMGNILVVRCYDNLYELKASNYVNKKWDNRTSRAHNISISNNRKRCFMTT